MAGDWDWKFGRYLEWCTELPKSRRPRKSPDFLFKGGSCHLLLYITPERDKPTHYNLDWKFNRKSPISEKFNAELHVGLKKEEVYSINAGSPDFGTDNAAASWIIDLEQLEALNDSGGCVVKFRMFFDNDAFPEDLNFATGNESIEKASNPEEARTDPCLEVLSHDFSELLKVESSHDVEVKCGDHVTNAHKTVLSMRSKVFANMIQSNMEESTTSLVELKEMDEYLFPEFMRYLYTGKLENLTFEKAKKLYEAGSKYKIKCLVRQCAGFLADNLATETASECLALADKHSDQKLKENVITYFLKQRSTS